MVAKQPGNRAVAPLKITCTSSDCERGLHCFRQKRRTGPAFGPCRSCGKDLIDWPRVHRRDLHDVESTFRALQVERIRHHFWHVGFDQKAINHALRKGFAGIITAAANRIRKAVGEASPSFDGRQTPKVGNVIFYAQHATASCCRTCIEEWHAIPRGRALTGREVAYLTELAMRYIRHRMPRLGEAGIKVPPMRRRVVPVQ